MVPGKELRTVHCKVNLGRDDHSIAGHQNAEEDQHGYRSSRKNQLHMMPHEDGDHGTMNAHNGCWELVGETDGSNALSQRMTLSPQVGERGPR